MKIQDINQNMFTTATLGGSSVSGEKPTSDASALMRSVHAAEVSISEEGLAALEARESGEGLGVVTGEWGTVTGGEGWGETRKLSREKTNEVYWEHLMEMGQVMQGLKKDYNIGSDDSVDSFMKMVAQAYEILYHKIVEAHKNGDREVNYEISGEGSLSLEEDLAGLDEAYGMWSNFVGGAISGQQVVKAFKSGDFQRYLGEEFDTYRRNTVSMMDQALALFKSMNEPQGMATGVLANLMNRGGDFWKKTRELWS